MFVFHPRMSAAGPLRSLLLDSLGREAPDDQVHAVLSDVGLDDAVARHGGLDAERDWSADLSSDELLALIFARLLLAAPRFAFLDCLAGASDNFSRSAVPGARPQLDHVRDRRVPARAARFPPQPARLARG